MADRRTPATNGLGWESVDPRLTSPEDAEPLQQVLLLAKHDWELDTQIDVQAGATERLLNFHRISTLIPTRNVLAHSRDDHRARLAQIYGVQMRIEATAEHVLEIMNDEDLDHRVLKGLASAELDYPSRSLRHTGDVDLAIRPDQVEAAIGLLRGHDYTHHWAADSKHRSKGATLVAPNGVEIDLHTRLLRRSRLTRDALFKEAEPLQGLPSSALCLEHRLVHAAGHFILAPPGTRRMSGLVDITRIRSRQPDLDAAREFAAAIGIEPLVGMALRLEGQLAGRSTNDTDLALWRTPDWIDRKTRASARRYRVLDHVNRFREVAPARRLLYLREWVMLSDQQRRTLRRTIKTSVTELKETGRDRFNRR